MEHDNLLEKEILSLLSPELPLSLLCFDELPSTNTFLKELGRAGTPANTVCLARCQSAGRGRLGRRFESRAGQGLYLSMLLRPRVSPEAMLPATGLAAVAAMAAVEKASGLICGIKWTNDLVCRQKKLCGILAELGFSPEGMLDHVVIGVGINMNQRQEDFPPELQPMATSLLMEEHPASLPVLAASLIRELFPLTGLLESGEYEAYLARYRSRCLTLGKEVLLVKNGESRPARALDIDDSFGLLVEYPDGNCATVTMGEASVRGLYGYMPQ
mgnify:FL=1